MNPFVDAVGSYFLARALGADVLQTSGRFEHVIQVFQIARGKYQST